MLNTRGALRAPLEARTIEVASARNALDDAASQILDCLHAGNDRRTGFLRDLLRHASDTSDRRRYARGALPAVA